jgi:biotin carboxyl carrier protein
MAKLEIRSPLPGTFYRRSKPEAPEYKKDGDAVQPNDTIGLIEVMKTFHEVPAGVAGKAITFLIEDADAVMAGQVVAEVEQ